MGSASRPSSRSDGLRLTIGSARSGDIAGHLRRCDALFVPPLSSRVEIQKYARKLGALAVTFEAWDGDALVGLVAAYLHGVDNSQGFVTSVSVEARYQRAGLGDVLIGQCIGYARARGLSTLRLEVSASSDRALRLYRKHGFRITCSRDALHVMTLNLSEQVHRD